jgi:hypothetical protein
VFVLVFVCVCVCSCVTPIRAIASGEAELSDMAAGISEVEGRVAALEAEAEEKQGDIQVRAAAYATGCDAAAA